MRRKVVKIAAPRSRDVATLVFLAAAMQLTMRAIPAVAVAAAVVEVAIAAAVVIEEVVVVVVVCSCSLQL